MSNNYILMPYDFSDDWEEVDASEVDAPVLLSEASSSESGEDRMSEDAERFWGLNGSQMGSAANNSYSQSYAEPFMDVYQREVEQVRRERDGDPPTTDELDSLVQQFRMH